MSYNIAHTNIDKALSVTQALKRYAGIYLGDTHTMHESDTICKTAALRTGPGGVYGISHFIPKQGEGYYMGFVVLVEREKGNFRWLVINETSGPARDEAPASILRKLELLSDLKALVARDIIDAESAKRAQEWRSAGKRRLERKAKMQPGAVLEFKEPIKFAPGQEISRFLITEAGRTIKLMAMPEEGRSFPCRLQQSIYSRDFSIREAN